MYLSEQNPHGGDTYTNGNLLDFSANINPYGMPEAVKTAAARAAAASTVYPDPYCRALREKLSAREGVPTENILCGSGAAELIYSFAYALPKDKPALIFAPTFCEYAAALRAAGIAVEYAFLKEENGFAPTSDLLQGDFSRYGALFLCTPNNPTGKTVAPELLEQLCACGVRIFCDACFLDLTDAPDCCDLPRLLRAYPNLLVLKSLTKSFAIPGLRLGYALSRDTALLDEMAKKTSCWNISLPAQAAGEAACACGAWLETCVRKISAERAWLSAALRKIGVTVFDGEANFLLLKTLPDLAARLRARGICVRDCANYEGLGNGFVRVAVRTPKENDKLLTAISEVLR